MLIISAIILDTVLLLSSSNRCAELSGSEIRKKWTIAKVGRFMPEYWLIIALLMYLILYIGDQNFYYNRRDEEILHRLRLRLDIARQELEASLAIVQNEYLNLDDLSRGLSNQDYFNRLIAIEDYKLLKRCSNVVDNWQKNIKSSCLRSTYELKLYIGEWVMCIALTISLIIVTITACILILYASGLRLKKHCQCAYCITDITKEKAAEFLNKPSIYSYYCNYISV